jgi:hypothetical protein
VDGFTIFVVCVIIALFVVFYALGRLYPGSGADVLDWKPTRSMETEVELELQDVDQMIEAQNERRRRTGRPERTEEDVRAEVAKAQEEERRLREGYDPGPQPDDR